MKRRAFLTALFGIAAAPAVAKLPVPSIGVDKASALGSTSVAGIFGRLEGFRFIESDLAQHNHVLPTRIDEEFVRRYSARCADELRRTVAGGIDVQEMRRMARADLKAQGVAWA